MEGDEPLKDKLKPERILDLYDKGKQDTKNEVAQAVVNRSFIGTRHWVFFDAKTGQIADLPRRNPRRVRATVPRIGPDSVRIISKLMKRDIGFDVPPLGADSNSRMSARLAENIIESERREHAWEELRADHAWATWVTGTGGLCTEWDPEAGDHIGDGVYAGDVRTTVLDIGQMITSPGTPNIERAFWWIKAEALPPSAVQEQYGLDREPSANAATSGDGVRPRYGNDGVTDTQQLATVLTFFHRPSKRIPKGQIVTLVDEEVVNEEDWYFDFDDRLNIVTARQMRLHNRWSGATMLSQAVDVQVLYNQAWSSLIEHHKQAGNARLMAPTGSIDDPHTLTDTAGEFVEYMPQNNGEKPSYLNPAQLPDWVLTMPEKLEQALNNTLGVHDISRGEAPRNVESGLALSILSENDDTPVGLFAKELGNAWARHATNVLHLYRSHAKEKRKAVIRNENNDFESYEWHGKDIDENLKVVVPADAVIPRSRAALAAFAMEMKKNFPDDVSIEMLTSIADLPGRENMVDVISPDTVKARRENMAMGRGEVPIVAEFDDNENHMKVHRDYMRTERFEESNDKVQQVFSLHMKAHEVMAAEQLGKKMQAEMIHPALGTLPTTSDPTPGQGEVPPKGMEALPFTGGPGGPPPMPAGAPPVPVGAPPMPPMGGGMPQGPPPQLPMQ